MYLLMLNHAIINHVIFHYAITELINNEIDRLLAEGIILPVTYSDWTAPVVPIVKADKKIRLCGDYKLYKCTTNNSDPLPNIEDLYAKPSGGKIFISIDLRHAHEQLPLTAESRKYVTIKTHRGLFTYTRLPYGILVAPSIFQSVIDSLFQWMPPENVNVKENTVKTTTVTDVRLGVMNVLSLGNKLDCVIDHITDNRLDIVGITET